jgi:hypothetical protein
MANSYPKLIVGVDFGTTFTGSTSLLHYSPSFEIHATISIIADIPFRYQLC